MLERKIPLNGNGMLNILKQKLVSNSMRVERHLPGEIGLWMFIGGDMMVFSLFFVVFVHDLGINSEMFHTCQAQLNQNFAAINTVLLLISSWFVVTAVEAMREEKGRIAPACLLAAFVCGLAFCIIKFFEYREKAMHGIALNTNEFWTLYFMFTGIHLAHVLIGLGVLIFLMRVSWDGGSDSKRISFMESGASYWHMVDLLWIGLFALFYLVK